MKFMIVMAYQYSKLLNEAEDVRLLTLLPGSFDDVIRITISHIRLTKPALLPTSVQQQPSLEELQRTLPPFWKVYETLEGQYLYEQVEDDYTTWTHPDPEVPLPAYMPWQRETSSASPHQYEALSYTWGSFDRPVTIRVESNLNGGSWLTLQIQRNLAEALRHLRYPDKCRLLWVDAICINQKDVGERNSQVLRMADIYTSAIRVVVWLGAESGSSKLAISTLNHLGAQVELTKNYMRLSAPGSEQPSWYRAVCELPYETPTWQAILDLMRRPWFDRLWIVQEIQLANHRAVMQCGFEEISWSQFRKAAICLDTKLKLPSEELSSRILFVSNLSRPLTDRSFPSLLYVSSGRLCSDPRDHVYGLLGLASPTAASRIRPQYSTTVTSLYKETVEFLLSQTKRLNFLEECSARRSRIHQLPSWVPDWSAPRERIAFLGGGLGGRLASGLSCADARFLPENVLEASGVQSTIVRSVKGPAPKDADQALAAIQSWAPGGVQTALYPTGESLLDAFASALVMNRFRNRVQSSAISNVAEWKKELLDHLSKPPGSAGEEIAAKKKHILDYLKGMVFITVEDGYFGLATSNVEPGKN